MMNPFPTFLAFGLVAPLILRVTLGGLFVIEGYKHLTSAREPRRVLLESKLGDFAKTAVWISGGVEMLMGIFFIMGFLTPIVAILAGLGSIKVLWRKWRRSELAALEPYSPMLYLLIVAISLSLLFSGAGCWAVDRPL